MRLFYSLLTGLAVAVSAHGVFAQAAQSELEKATQAITKNLEAGKPGVKVSSVEPAAIPGMYKASIEGGPHVYTTADGVYFIAGDIYKVTPGSIVNLTDQERNGDRAKAMASIDKKDTITFAPKGDVKKVMYVFTDVDCGYCQKLHAQVPEYNELGIEVRYLAYPRAGINSRSYKKVASAWCAEDPQDALTKLKQRQNIPENVCADNPVAKQFQIGQQIGLSGTPALVFEDGQLIGGYVEPARLKDMLEL